MHSTNELKTNDHERVYICFNFSTLISPSATNKMNKNLTNQHLCENFKRMWMRSSEWNKPKKKNTTKTKPNAKRCCQISNVKMHAIHFMKKKKNKWKENQPTKQWIVQMKRRTTKGKKNMSILCFVFYAEFNRI